MGKVNSTSVSHAQPCAQGLAKSALTLAAILALGVAASACATAPSSSGARVASAAAGGAYAPGDRLYRNNHIETLFPRETTLEEARHLEKAAYAGIEGARLAHRVHGRFAAEELDGACEPEVRRHAGETLADVAALCDVSVRTLAAFNPDVGVDEPAHARQDGVITIPFANAIDLSGAINASFIPGAEGGDASASAHAPHAATYHVAEGDTLGLIAGRFGLSAAQLANANPSVDWPNLQPGAAVRLPKVENRTETSRPEAPMRKPIAPTPATTTGVSTLSVSSTVATPGESVGLSAYGLPAGATVSLYRGPNRRELQHVADVVIGADGVLDTAAAATGADLGGVIFAAAIDGEFVYSPRVSVVKLRNEARR